MEELHPNHAHLAVRLDSTRLESLHITYYVLISRRGLLESVRGVLPVRPP